MTRTLEFQMSGPVPSPMMNGMIGWSGTWSLPFWMEILAPPSGGATFGLVGVAIGAVLSRAGEGAAMLTHGCSVQSRHADSRFNARRRWFLDARRVGATFW